MYEKKKRMKRSRRSVWTRGHSILMLYQIKENTEACDLIFDVGGARSVEILRTVFQCYDKVLNNPCSF